MSDVFQGQNAEILEATIDGTPYTEQPQSYIAQLLLELKAVIEAGGGGGTTNYNGLSNKPQINDVTLQGNQSLADLGINIPPVDSEISGTSENPLQNKVVKGALDGKQNVLTFDNAPTENSNNPVKSGGVYSALGNKQDTLTFDNAPTENSNNPVKSGGVYSALGNKQDTLTFDNAPTENSNNPVKSGGVYTAVKTVDDKLFSSIAGITQNAKGSMELYSEDLNDIVTSGFYNAMTCTNAPFTYCALIVCGYYLSGYCFQLAADITTGEVKTRIQNNGTWSAWAGGNNITYSS